MGIVNVPGETAYYFVKLPAFLLSLSRRRFSSFDDVLRICPQGPHMRSHHDAVRKACETFGFLKGRDPERLAALYSMISAIREADAFVYPFLTRRTVAAGNSFVNLDLLAEAYERGPVLLLYAHTGSYYQTIAATGVRGYKVYPFADWIDPSALGSPFGRLYRLNMKLSERCFSGGHYLYLNTPSFLSALKRIMKGTGKAVIFAAIDLPRTSTTEKRLAVDFLGGRIALPYRVIESFTRHGFPVLI
jgi:hypothetical protein